LRKKIPQAARPNSIRAGDSSPLNKVRDASGSKLSNRNYQVTYVSRTLSVPHYTYIPVTMIFMNKKFYKLTLLDTLLAQNYRTFTTSSVNSSNMPVPVAASYLDSDTQKLVIYEENKEKCGIYM
jgi:hypothetical protein